MGTGIRAWRGLGWNVFFRVIYRNRVWLVEAKFRNLGKFVGRSGVRVYVRRSGARYANRLLGKCGNASIRNGKFRAT